MKASEVVAQLERFIKMHGDRECYGPDIQPLVRVTAGYSSGPDPNVPAIGLVFGPAVHAKAKRHPPAKAVV